ncbi:SMC-Scp complex subunit ScpB [Dermatobacter hominis]|uniref:SMC-Scp complex subunit ScpB n=1 Tax=Dermatobacter hominis TaxID=2884263 RepID=UPI001D1161A7|nr:SMC-Scp complex subunit ScpB [Dermatobacter hominis]UDY36257.1 SMC-Scp complex subunit ScpB [Dermatobacter hominis]
MAEHTEDGPEAEATDAARPEAAGGELDDVAADAAETGEIAEQGDEVAEAHEDAERGDAAAELAPLGDEARRALEAVLMVADQPIEAALLAQLVERSPQQVEDLLAGLAASYEEDGRGFQLVRVAGGWRFQSHEDLSPYVERFVLSGQSARLSAAALETLAIVAYKQPISRAQVSAIRGVNVDGVMRTLQQRGYIAEVGKDPGPGQPSMFGTTSLFLEKLGLNEVDELPSLGDFIPGADVVELLEQGLRAEADEPAMAADDQTATEGADGEQPEGAASVDDGVVDITDEVVISVDDLVDDGSLADDPTSQRPSPFGE